MIYDTTDVFDFSGLQLENPTPLQDGYYTKLLHNKNSLYVYTPKCTTKGVVTSSKNYIDFLISPLDTSFIQWMNSLEEKLQELLYNKKEWFLGDDIELDDIQSSFLPLIKVKGMNYVIRGYQGKHIKESIQVYNEDEIPVSLNSIQDTTQVISILDISGIKFNTKCFQVMIHTRQIMVLEKSLFSNCLIKTKLKENPEVKIDELETITLKTPHEVYQTALEKASVMKMEADRAREIAEELRITYEIE